MLGIRDSRRAKGEYTFSFAMGKKLLSYAWATALQMMAISVGRFLVQGMLTDLGTNVVTGYNMGFKVEQLNYENLKEKLKGSDTQTREEQIENLEYSFKKNCLGYALIIKLPCMRKQGEFCIYQENYSDKYYYLQEDGKCFAVEKATGRAIYTNKGSCPMDYYLTFKPTAKFTLPMQLVNDIKNTLAGDSRVDKDGGIIIDFSCV